jgi:hypothetical protein
MEIDSALCFLFSKFMFFVTSPIIGKIIQGKKGNHPLIKKL